jgi:hypothetical protein
VLRVDCRRCGHYRFIRPSTLYRRLSPVHPWRWLRFRCNQCRSGDVVARAGAPIDLVDGPVPLWQRGDLLNIAAEAVQTYFTFTGGEVPRITRARVGAAAGIVLRRLMAAGVRVGEPDPPAPPPPAG